MWENVPVARFHSTLFCVSVIMEGVWSSPFEFPRVPDDEEELDGDMSLVGTGGLSGYGADGDTRTFGSGRSSGYGYDYGDMNEDGLSPAITPFVGGAMRAGLGSGGPIGLIGNTRRVGHRKDLSKHGGARERGGERAGGRGGESRGSAACLPPPPPLLPAHYLPPPPPAACLLPPPLLAPSPLLHEPKWNLSCL